MYDSAVTHLYSMALDPSIRCRRQNYANPSGRQAGRQAGVIAHIALKLCKSIISFSINLISIIPVIPLQYNLRASLHLLQISH